MRRLLPDPVEDLDPAALEAVYALPDLRAGDRHVRANFVSSVDGAVEIGGRSEPLSGPTDKRVFGLLRRLCDVVLVGAGTVRAEGYRPLRAGPDRRQWRRDRGLSPVPPVAVVTRRLDLDLDAELFTAAAARPLILTTAAAPSARRAAAARVAEIVLAGRDRVEVDRALDALGERGLRRVLCEGGPRLLADLVAADRLDELCLTLTPLLAGPARARLVRGAPFVAPVPLALAHVLEDAGTLFLRYRRGRPHSAAASSSGTARQVTAPVTPRPAGRSPAGRGRP